MNENADTHSENMVGGSLFISFVHAWSRIHTREVKKSHRNIKLISAARINKYTNTHPMFV